AGFAAGQSPEMVVNSPANRVLTGPQTIGAFKAGLIHYASSERVIEYAAVRPTGEVLLMGEEHVTPVGATRNAGKAETYRVTEIWRKDGDRWVLSVRHATISAVQ
ncbi:MAG: nuclear transport factor 2 family protein, partial [Sphingomonadaceae bacterium]|nr:nuclear transport factor 2 family protein [Sphingomonadaceae bacterium]